VRKIILVTTGLICTVASLAPATATVVPIVTYNQVSSGSTLRWVRAPSGTGGQLFTIASSNSTTPGSATVNFGFLQPVLAALGPLAAKLTLTASSTQAAVPVAGFLTQQSMTGQFAFTYTGAAPLTVGFTTYNTGANLLSGSFTNGVIVGATGGTAGFFSASTGGGSAISMASDFIDFVASTKFDLSVGLNALSSPFGQSNAQSALNSFRAAGNGSFGADAPGITATIPEPASWALMVGGFGALGATMRRRRLRRVAA